MLGGRERGREVMRRKDGRRQKRWEKGWEEEIGMGRQGGERITRCS